MKIARLIAMLTMTAIMLTMLASCGALQGEQGLPGKDGITPTLEISADGYWIINGVNTNVKATSEGSATNDPSVKVQRITYMEGEKIVYLTSTFGFSYTAEDLTYEEYFASEELIYDISYISGIIQMDGTVQSRDWLYPYDESDTPEDLKRYIGKSFYAFTGCGSTGYQKIILTEIYVSYLYVDFVNDDTFDVSYYSNSFKKTITKRIKTSYYKIDYFLD